MAKASLAISIYGDYNGKAIAKCEADLRRMSVTAAREAGGVGSSFVGAGDKVVAFGNQLQYAGDKVEATGKSITKLTAPLAAVGAASVKLASDYEQSVAKVYTIMDKGAMSTQDMAKNILDLSTSTGRSATELADATYQALSASVATDKVAGFVADAVKLSKAGFTETATAVDTLTTVINAYGYSADDAEMITNRLVQTQNKGKTTVNELASSMGNVIPTASAYNVSLDNLCSAYVIMTKQGINTANATTAINGMLTELASEGSDVADILKEKTGKSFGQLMADGMSLGDVLQILSDHVGGNSEQFANLWGNVRASKGALAIANAGASEFTKTMGDMADSTGLVDKALDDLATPTAKAQKAINALKNTGIELGQEIIGAAAPSIEKLAEAAQGLYKWFGELDEGTRQNVVRLGALAVAAGPVITVFGKMLSAAGGLVAGFGKGMQSAGALARELSLVKNATSATVGPTMSFGQAVTTLGTSQVPALTRALGMLKAATSAIAFTAVIALIGILVEKFTEWQQHVELVNRATADLSSVMGAAEQSYSSFSAAADGTAKSVSSVVDAANKCLEAQASLNDETRSAWAEMGTAAAKVDYYAGVIADLADKEGLTAEEQFRLSDAVGNFNELTGNSISVLDAQNGKLSTTRENVLLLADAWKQEAEAKALEEIYSKYVQQAIEDSMSLEEATQKLQSASEGFGIWIGDFPVFADEASVSYHDLQKSVDELTAAESSSKAMAEEAMKRRMAMVPTFSSLEDAMASCGMEMSDLGDLTEEELAEMEANFDGTLSSVAKTCQSQGRDIPVALANGMKQNAPNAEMQATNIKKNIESRLSTLPASLRNTGLGSVSNMAAGMLASLPAVGSAASSLLSRANSGVSSMPSSYRTTGASSGQGLAGGLSSTSGGVSGAATGLLNSAERGVSPAPASFRSTGTSAGNSFASGVGSVSAWGQGNSLANSALSGASSVSAWGAGSNFTSGFAGGLLSAAWTAAANARSVAYQSLSALRSALGIASPSKETIAVGEYFGEGLVVGMRKMEGAVARETGRLDDIMTLEPTGYGTFAMPAHGYGATGARAAGTTMYVTVSVNAQSAEQGRAVGTSLADALYEELNRKEASRL